MCARCLDLREGFHPGNPAGPSGCSRWGGAGVRSGAQLCSCSGLQLCLEVEDQRRSAGDEIEPTALSIRPPQCHLNRVTCSWPSVSLFKCLTICNNMRGPCYLRGWIHLPGLPLQHLCLVFLVPKWGPGALFIFKVIMKSLMSQCWAFLTTVMFTPFLCLC